MRSRVASVLLAGLLLSAASCSTKTPTPTAAPTAKPPSSVVVALSEYELVPESAVAAAGPVSFSVRNHGKVVHEMVVVRTKLDAGMLPTKADGSVDESKVDHPGEVSDLAPAKKQSLTLNLTPGSYVLMCNIVDSGKVHYKLGMRTAFTVS
jgi:uncharacterized cupredoxin-like copper-binding protein